MPEVRIELRDTTNNVVGDIEILDSESFPLSLTYSNFDVRDLGSRKGSFSKSFKIPATKSNNKILEHLYFDGFVDVKNIKSRKTATIYVDNIPILTGQLQATKVIKGEEAQEYECVFFGDNMSWASELKDKSLNTLDLGSQVYDNILSTWNTNNYDPEGDTPDADQIDEYPIVYPLCSVGEGDNTGNGVMESDFIPHIFIKKIWDEIFSNLTNKFAVVSQFCNSAFFRSLVMPLNFERTRETIDQYSGKAIRNSDELINTYWHLHKTSSSLSLANMILRHDYEISSSHDNHIYNLNSWTRAFWFRMNAQEDSSLTEGAEDANATGNVRQPEGTADDDRKGAYFLVNQDGSYDISFNINLQITVSDTPDFNGTVNTSLWAKLYKKSLYGSWEEVPDIGNDGVVGEAEQNFEEYFDPIDHTISGSVTVNNASAFDKYAVLVYVKLRDWGSDEAGSFRLYVKEGSYLQGVANPNIALGESYNAGELLPRANQSELVKGIAKLANLQFYTDAASRTIYVEPYDYFFLPKSDGLDWSDKIDHSKGVVDEFIHDIKKNIIFSYSGEDGLVERFNKRNEYDYATYVETDTTGTFFDGVFEISNDFFEPTFMIYEGDYVQTELAKAPLIPTYWSSYSQVHPSLYHTRPDKSFDTGSRVLIWRGKKSSETTKFDYLGTNIGGTPTEKTEWGRAVFTDWDAFETVGQDPSSIYDGHQYVHLNLAYTSYDTTSPDGSAKVINGLYKSYYANMINQLKDRPRIKTAYFKLSVKDVMNFDFRKLVYINGLYYRVNKIIDYKPHRNETTKVELVEFRESGTGSITTRTDTFKM